ncbi:hypothetical protein J4426_00090 [Candidatus Woesearchaeota archaeon]|nr:hypothetical protein [Candidatus Woesearchaeota archaeon]
MQEQLQVNPTERIRLLESRYSALRDRILITNQNMIAGYKKLHEEVKEVEADIRELKTDVFEIKNSITKIAEELRFFAKKEQIRVIEKYIDLWNPLKFVTESDLKKILEERGDKNSRTKRPIQPKYGRE